MYFKKISKILSLILFGIMFCSVTSGCENTADRIEEITNETTTEQTEITAEETEKTDSKETEPPETIDYSEIKTIEHNGKTWKLTFSDEFDSTKLDTKKWEYLPDQVRDTSTWVGDATYFEDGCLILKVEAGEQPYHAGAIRTMGKFEQAYGYFEVKCKVPTISGVNAAFWLIGGSMWTKEELGGVDGAEIDIFETNALAENQFQHAIHWDGYAEYHGSTDYPIKNKNIYDGEFHVFGFEWTESQYIFYVDGEETWRTKAGGICTAPLYLKLTVATGGWVGDPDPSLLPTDAMVVDYVRVYEEVK